MFIASIPEYVFYKKGKISEIQKYFHVVPDNGWINLPAKNKYQNDRKANVDFSENFHHVFSSEDPAYKNDHFYENDETYEKVENKPIDLYLVGYKSKGKSYDYKKQELIVCNDKGYCFPIGHDVFINAVLNNGIDKNGKLPGKYLFVRFSKKVKIIQANSGIHKAVIELVSNKDKKKIDIKSMTVGDVYSDKAGNAALFLGFVSTQSMIVDLPPSARRFCVYTDRSAVEDINRPVEDFGVRFVNKKLLSLWMELGNVHEGFDSESETVEKMLDRSMKNKEHYVFHVREKHSYNKKLNIKRVDVPNDVIMRIRSFVNSKTEYNLSHMKKYRARSYKFGTVGNAHSNITEDKTRHYDAVFVSDYSKMLNMVPFGVKPTRSKLCNIFNQWETKKNKFKV